MIELNFKSDFLFSGLADSLIGGLIAPTLLVGLNGEIVSASPAAESLMATSDAATLRGRAVSDFTDEAALDGLRNWVRDTLSGRATAPDWTVNLQQAAGPASWIVKPVPDDYAKVVGFLYQHIGPDLTQTDDAAVAAGRRFDVLAETELRWKTAVLSASQGVWDHDFERNRHYLSESWRTMRGLAPDATAPESTEDWLLTIHRDDIQKVREQLHLQESGLTDIVNYTFRQRHAAGHWIWILSRGRVMRRDAAGFPVHIIGTDTDITEIKAVEQERTRLAERLALAMEVAEMGQWEFDIDSGRTAWDTRAAAMLGVTADAVERTGPHWSDLIHPDDRQGVIAYNAARLRAREDIAYDYRVLTDDGSERYIRTRGKFLPSPEGGGTYVGVDFDLTPEYRKTRALEQARSQLEYESRHDALTGLANRRSLDEVFANALATAPETPLAAMHFDIDRFKQINDSLGHDAGDVALRHVATILRDHMPPGALVARAGGDEFVTLFVDAPAEDVLQGIADRITTALAVPFAYHAAQIRTDMSIGIARTAPGDAARGNLFIIADMALYHAKTDGRATCRFYHPGMMEESAHRKRLEDALSVAFAQDQIICHYQPQFDARSLKMTGLEALVRWQCPQHGLIMPDHFLGIASDMGLMARLDDAVLRQVLRDTRAWASAGLDVPHVSVNISAERLTDPQLGPSLRALQIVPGTIVFELLESVFLDGADATIDENLAMLADLGIEIEIDDFGSGHASIISLLRIAPRRLKIDRALVQPIVTSPQRRALLETIIRIGRMLHIDVVAEGVESADHVRILQDLKCDILQGYALARPVPPGQVPDLLISR